MKILITGATGKVGEEVTKTLAREMPDAKLVLVSGSIKEIIPKRNQKIIQAFYEDVKWIKNLIFDEKPDVIVNCAAMTNVDSCEDDHNTAMKLNAILPETLAKAAKQVDSQLISISTDYIFDGKNGPYDEEATPNPISYYGKSKLAGENAIKIELDEKFTIIRTNVVYGKSSYNKSDFIQWLIANLEQGKSLKIIDGQWCNPTFTEDIAWSILKIIEGRIYGVYNISGDGYYNRYEIANLVCDVFEFDKNLITKVPENDLVQKAKRPSKGGLLNLKAQAELGIKFLDMKSGLITLKFKDIKNYESE